MGKFNNMNSFEKKKAFPRIVLYLLQMHMQCETFFVFFELVVVCFSGVLSYGVLVYWCTGVKFLLFNHV